MDQLLKNQKSDCVLYSIEDSINSKNNSLLLEKRKRLNKLKFELSVKKKNNVDKEYFYINDSLIVYNNNNKTINIKESLLLFENRLNEYYDRLFFYIKKETFIEKLYHVYDCSFNKNKYSNDSNINLLYLNPILVTKESIKENINRMFLFIKKHKN
jgi:hypothetical protein